MLKNIILEISPLLPVNKQSKKIRNELVYRAKYGKNISRVINKILNYII